MKQIFLTAAGFVLLGLGAVGLLLPVWPTTPFVIGAAACFSASPALGRKLLQLPFFGEHIENYKNRKGLSGKTLAASLIFLWLMLGLSILLVQTLWVKFLLLAIGAAVSIHILMIAKPKGSGGSRPSESINEK